MNIYGRSPRGIVIILLSYSIFTLVFLLPVISAYPVLTWMAIFATISLAIVLIYLIITIGPIKLLLDKIYETAHKRRKFSFIKGNKTIRKAFAQLEDIAETLQSTEEKLSHEKSGISAILQNIGDAVWIQNSKGKIVTYNDAFQKLVQGKNVKYNYFWNVVKDPQLYNLADKVFKKPQNSVNEIQILEDYYLISASHSSVNNEILFIAHNISETKKVEILKKDFVLNVSHELRTPLTAIKGFLETLEPELNNDQRYYTDVIKRNTERLINIVNDLLTLSRLEHDTSVELEKINISEFTQQIEKIFIEKLKVKNLRLNIKIEEGLEYFTADAFKMEQVFVNLIDNAIKYSDKGSISLFINHTNRRTKILISDTGIGIPQHDLGRIFERFYVVNKSRTKKYSSTGLGLSIVKHIINLHQGTIDVESKENQGSTFTIILPEPS